MQKFITNIIAYSVALFFNALSFIPGITVATVTQAWNDLKTAGDKALEDYTASPTDSTTVKIEVIVYNGLEIAQNACDAAGDTKLDAYFTIAENVDKEIESGSFNFISAIKAWIQSKKAAKS